MHASVAHADHKAERTTNANSFANSDADSSVEAGVLAVLEHGASAAAPESETETQGSQWYACDGLIEKDVVAQAHTLMSLSLSLALSLSL